MKKYFDVRDVIAESPNTHIFNIIGQGGVGKSYSVKRYILLEFFNNGKQFVYVRRWTTELTQLDTVFTDMEDDPEIVEAWQDSKWRKKRYQNRKDRADRARDSIIESYELQRRNL